MPFGGFTKLLVLLIVPEGIEIMNNVKVSSNNAVLLIVPEGIEIRQKEKLEIEINAFNRTRRN